MQDSKDAIGFESPIRARDALTQGYLFTTLLIQWPTCPTLRRHPFFFVTCFCPGQARECAKIAAKAGEIDKLFLHVQVIFLRSKFVCEFTHFRNLLNRVKKL